MISERKLEANRRNARKSTGPRSKGGKGRSAQNALTHGLTTRLPVIPAVEKASDYDTFLASLRESIQPKGALEDTLVLSVTSSYWRLQRAQRHEQEVLASEFEEEGRQGGGLRTPGGTSRARGEEPEEMEATGTAASGDGRGDVDDGEVVRPRFIAKPRQMKNLIRYERHLHFALHRDLRELRRLRIERARAEAAASEAQAQADAKAEADAEAAGEADARFELDTVSWTAEELDKQHKASNPDIQWDKWLSTLHNDAVANPRTRPPTDPKTLPREIECLALFETLIERLEKLPIDILYELRDWDFKAILRAAFQLRRYYNAEHPDAHEFEWIEALRHGTLHCLPDPDVPYVDPFEEEDACTEPPDAGSPRTAADTAGGIDT